MSRDARATHARARTGHQETERRCPHVGRLRTRGRPPRTRSGPRLPLPELKAPRACSKAVGEMKARAADALRPAARGTPKELETREADDGRAPRPRRSRPPGSATSRCRSITSGTAPLSLTRPTRHRLHLEELSEPKLAALAPVTRRLDAAKRRARAAPLAIHLNHSGLELRHDAPDAIG